MATATKKKTSRSTTRQPAVKNLWTHGAPPLTFGREQFRFRLTRHARQLPPVDIDPWVEGVDWERSGGIRTGELNFRRPLGQHTASMVTTGDKIVCELDVWGSGGPWRRLWELKVGTPSHDIQPGVISLALTAALDPLTRSKVSWKFSKDKAHPDGWDAVQITRAVCKRFGVKIAQLPKASYRNAPLVEKSLSPYDMIVRAWSNERKHTGRRFDIDLSLDEVAITEVREPLYMLLLGAAIADATLDQSLAGLATAVIATSTHKASGSRKAGKLRVKVADAGRRRRYGYIVKTVTAPSNIQSLAALRAWAKKLLAQSFRTKKTVTFTHPGLPLVDRGDALRLYLPEADFHQIVFVTSVRHDLSAGSYTMDVTIGFDDPWAADLKAARVQKKKDAAAAARNRKAVAAVAGAGGAGGVVGSVVVPAKAASRRAA